MSRVIYCIKLQKEAEGLEHPPYPGNLGERVYEAVSKEAWQLWLRHQTLLINEQRLQMTDPNHRKYLKDEMEKFFFGEGSSAPSGFKPHSKDN